MLKYLKNENMGRSKHSWLDSIHHFSFAGYYNPYNMNFGILRVVNDDKVKPGTGFDTHPHNDMEIISYVVDGKLTHADSMNNKRCLTRGQVQYMSAGTGVMHSEHNLEKEGLRFLQIWILPDNDGYEPNYGDYEFKWESRIDSWLPIATSTDNKVLQAPIHIHADMNVFATFLTKGKNIEFKVDTGRQAYLVLIEGTATIGEQTLNAQDAMEITEEDINISALEDSHMIIFEMKKQ